MQGDYEQDHRAATPGAGLIFFPAPPRRACPHNEAFLRAWLQSGDACRDPAFAEQSAALGIDLALPRVVMAMRIRQPAESAGMGELLAGLKRELSVYLPGGGHLGVRMGGDGLAMLLHARETAYVAQRMIAYKKAMECRYGVTLCCGIGPVCHTPAQVAEAYREAKKACEASAGSPDKKTVIGGEASLETLLAEIPLEIRRQFFQKVFGNCPPEQKKDWVEDLHVYFENNGSIGAAAGQAHVHKNTMQYRLNRIAEATGFNPRCAKEAPVLYLAVLFARDDRIGTS